MNTIERTKSKLCISNKEYKVKAGIIETDPYWDEGMNFYPIYRSGYKNPLKRLLSYKIRGFKTWKHNRKTQYKI